MSEEYEPKKEWCGNCMSKGGGWWDEIVGEDGSTYMLWMECPVCRPKP